MAAPDLCVQVTDQAIGGAAGRRDGLRRTYQIDLAGLLPQLRLAGKWCGERGGEERVLVV